MLTGSGLKGQNLKNTKQPKNKESVEKKKELGTYQTSFSGIFLCNALQALIAGLSRHLEVYLSLDPKCSRAGHSK
jgi:hypothetical protein